MIYNIADNIVPIGVRGENLARPIEIDVSEITDAFESATVSLYLQRPGDASPYIATGTSVEDGILTWVPTSSDTGYAGTVQMQIVGTVDSVIVKTLWGHGTVEPSLGEAGDVPSAIQLVIDTLNEKIAEVEAMEALSSTSDDLNYILGV